MIARLDGNGDPYPTVILPKSFDELSSAVYILDANIFLIMVIYGYFFISLVQLVGIFGGDRSPLQVRSAKKAFRKSP